MALVKLDIADAAQRMTLAALLESSGHGLSEDQPEVMICDRIDRAVAFARHHAVLLLTPVSDIPNAVGAMRQGVYGYIVLPLQPGEADLMVHHAAGSTRMRQEPEPILPLSRIERNHIERVLKRCRGNRAKAARMLGIGRNTLWRKLKQYHLESEVAHQPADEGARSPEDP